MTKSLRVQVNGTQIAATTTNYTSFAGYNNWGTTETAHLFNCRPGGTFTLFGVSVITNTRDNTSTVRLRKNSADANSVISIAAGVTGNLEDTTSSDTFADGDDLSVSCVTTGTAALILLVRIISAVFDNGIADTTTQYGATGAGVNVATASATRFLTPTGFLSFSISVEANQAATIFKSACTAKNLQTRVVTNARTTTTTVRTRKNSANGAQTISITSTATGLFEDTTNTDSIAVNDTFNTAIVTGTGTQTLSWAGNMITMYSTTGINFLTLAGNTQAPAFGTTLFHPIMGVPSGHASETDSDVKVNLASGGIIKNLGWGVQTNSINGASTWTLRKNAADTALTVSIGASTTGWVHDTTNTVSVVATDLMAYENTIGGSSGSISWRLSNCELEVQNPNPTAVIHKRFQKDSSGTNGVTQDVFVGFAPKAVIIFGQGTNTNNSLQPHYQWSQGFSDGTNSACVCITSRDAATTSDTQHVYSNNSVYVRMDEATNTNVLERATVSFVGNYVRLTWAVNSTLASIIQMMAYGGSDITNAKVNTVQIGRTGTGTQNYTGLGFNPTGNGNSVLFTLIADTTAASNTSVATASSGFGCAVSSSKRWAISNMMEESSDPTDTRRITSTGTCISSLDRFTAGTVFSAADFSAWITDGFTLNWTINGDTTTLFSYLVIEGGTWDVGTLAAPTTATNDVDTAVSVNSEPIRGLLLATSGNSNTADGSPNSPATFAIGAADGITFSTLTCRDNDAVLTVISNRLNTNASIIQLFTSAEVLQDNAVFDSFSTNNFRLDWPTKSATATAVHWVVVADEPEGGQLYDKPISESTISVSESLARVQIILKPISETSVSISESLARIQTRKFTLAEPSISVSETLARVQTLIKTISETAVTVSETLARVPTYLKPISETSITVSEQLTKGLVYTKPINESAISINDTIVRIPLYLKPINETAITTNDSIARWISVSYTLTEPSISVNDSIQGALFYLRQISESAISVNDTIARILTAIRAISDPSISTNDTIVRIQTLLKTISESAISVNDSVAKVPTYVKSINEAAINTNDTIVRILAAVRTIADPSISVNDTITRIQTILKQISESAISVNDSVQAGLLLTISLVESRIKWYYSVLTRKITA